MSLQKFDSSLIYLMVKKVDSTDKLSFGLHLIRLTTIREIIDISSVVRHVDKHYYAQSRFFFNNKKIKTNSTCGMCAVSASVLGVFSWKQTVG